jgi:hypothetical protein
MSDTSAGGVQWQTGRVRPWGLSEESPTARWYPTSARLIRHIPGRDRRWQLGEALCRRSAYVAESPR